MTHMTIKETELKGVYVITSLLRHDNRGSFKEVYRKDIFDSVGIKARFVQENISSSKKGVIRGLHFQWDPPLGKLISVNIGRAFFAVVDIRRNSPTLGQWLSQELSDDNGLELYVPPGFASGFCAMSDRVDVHYKYTAFYNPAGESSIIWNDSKIGIVWPIQAPILSERDRAAGTLHDWLGRRESNLW